MHLEVITHPTAEPISLEEAKVHLRVPTGDTGEDALIRALIRAAREKAENDSGRAFVRSVVDLVLDAFPDDVLYVPIAPVAAIVGGGYSTYVDDAGATQSLPATVQLDSGGDGQARLSPAYGETWPTTRDQLNAVRLRLIVGHALPFASTHASDIVTVRNPESTGMTTGRRRVWNSGGALPAGLSEGYYYPVGVSALNGTTTFGLSLTSGGAAAALTDDGTGLHFLGTIPESARAAMLLMIGTWFEQREEASAQALHLLPAPIAAQRLLESVRVRRFV